MNKAKQQSMLLLPTLGGRRCVDCKEVIDGSSYLHYADMWDRKAGVWTCARCLAIRENKGMEQARIEA